MSDLEIHLRQEEIELELRARSTRPDSSLADSQVYTQIITTLIEQADTEFWENSVEELRPDDFWAEILEALARHYAVYLTEAEPLPASEWLKMLIDDLRQQGRLKELLPHSSSDDDE